MCKGYVGSIAQGVETDRVSRVKAHAFLLGENKKCKVLSLHLVINYTFYLILRDPT